MSNWRFGIVVVVLNGKPPLMGEVLCSTENSPFLIIDHIHAKMNLVCRDALAIGKKCMNVRKNKLFFDEYHVSKQYSPDWRPRFAASHLGLFCLPLSYKKDARLLWVNP